MPAFRIVQRGLRTPTGPFFARFFIGIILGLVAEFAFMGQSTRVVLSSSAARWKSRKQIGGLKCRHGCSTGRHTLTPGFWQLNRMSASRHLRRSLRCSVWRRRIKRHQPPCFLAHPEPLTTRIGERPMSRVTTNSGKGYRHNRRPRPQYQIDLFRSGLSNDASGAPAWPELPAEARAALTSLMMQLILDHAATTATPRAKEIDHDL
jgi:hypothetical protein